MSSLAVVYSFSLFTLRGGRYACLNRMARRSAAFAGLMPGLFFPLSPAKERQKRCEPGRCFRTDMAAIVRERQNAQEWPRQTKPKKGQFMNFSQGHSGTKVRYVNRACFPKEKHQNSQKWAKFMNFSFWPFLWFGLPGRLLKHININKFTALSRNWAGGKNMFMCFFGVTPSGPEKSTKKNIPPHKKPKTMQ